MISIQTQDILFETLIGIWDALADDYGQSSTILHEINGPNDNKDTFNIN